MSKPIIGISVDCHRDPTDTRTGGKLELNWNYAQVVAEAGGVPVLIPPMAEMQEVARLIHGWLIPGGNDIDAARFGERNHPSVELQDPSRYEAEASLMGSIDADLPVLGICYGCQFINVVRGGSLIQHLPDVTTTTHTGGVLQPYRVDPDSRLAQVAGETLAGKSYHHQAIRATGDNLNVVAKSEDGTIEAIEATDRPYMIGVQWHPERTFDDEATRRLFTSFIAAARTFMENQCEGSSTATSAI